MPVARDSEGRKVNSDFSQSSDNASSMPFVLTLGVQHR